jgi:hypothetical protein
MKKDINLEKMLDYIAVEEAPVELICKWKLDVGLQKERKKFYASLLRPSIVFPLVLAGLWYYFVIFKEKLFEYHLADRLRTLLQEINPMLVSYTSSIASSNYYIIGAGIFSVFLAGISLFWFYRGKKLKYAWIRNW